MSEQSERLSLRASELQCHKHPMPQSEDDLRLSAMFIDMLGCDAARISRPLNRLFLIIGTKKRSEGEWFTAVGDGPYKRFDFNYVDEKCVAHGDTEDELIASAQEYKRLCGMTMLEYLTEQIAKERP